MAALPRIVFFGTPEIAVASLDAIVKAGYPVRGVVTVPDMPAGRGLKVKSSAVKDYAMNNHLDLTQPEDLRDPAFIGLLREWSPEIQVVVAFRILPKEVYTLAPLGSFNLHASLLPQYRGAAPINWAIINGETETGVTTFFLQERMDTGNIILREKIPVFPDENAGGLHDRLMALGAETVIRTLDLITRNDVHPVSQEELVTPGIQLRKAPRIHKEDCRIDWNRDVATLHNFIRGLSPYPAAFTVIKGNDATEFYLKILKSAPEAGQRSMPPGTVDTDGKSVIRISANDGFMRLLEVQPAGRKPMTAGEFLHGFGRHFI